MLYTLNVVPRKVVAFSELSGCFFTAEVDWIYWNFVFYVFYMFHCFDYLIFPLLCNPSHEALKSFQYIVPGCFTQIQNCIKYFYNFIYTLSRKMMTQGTRSKKKHFWIPIAMFVPTQVFWGIGTIYLNCGFREGEALDWQLKNEKTFAVAQIIVNLLNLGEGV